MLLHSASRTVTPLGVTSRPPFLPPRDGSRDLLRASAREVRKGMRPFPRPYDRIWNVLLFVLTSGPTTKDRPDYGSAVAYSGEPDHHDHQAAGCLPPEGR